MNMNKICALILFLVVINGMKAQVEIMGWFVQLIGKERFGKKE